MQGKFILEIVSCCCSRTSSSRIFLLHIYCTYNLYTQCSALDKLTKYRRSVFVLISNHFELLIDIFEIKKILVHISKILSTEQQALKCSTKVRIIKRCFPSLYGRLQELLNFQTVRLQPREKIM